jgi:hypothetical protein
MKITLPSASLRLKAKVVCLIVTPTGSGEPASAALRGPGSTSLKIEKVIWSAPISLIQGVPSAPTGPPAATQPL